MTSSARRIARDLLPPVITRALSKPGAGALRFVDGYATWAQAEAAAGGYDDSAILTKVTAATREVVAGRAAFERDGTTFTAREYRWPVAAGLLASAARHGDLRVLDFGGSLGSTYFQHRPLFGDVAVRWAVVEQPSFVDAGQEFASDTLRFFPTIDACVDVVRPNVVLLSSVLQYLPNPHATLGKLLDLPVDAVIIDRTPMAAGAGDLPTVQQVPSSIYAASYPAWLLSHERLIEAFGHWDQIDEFVGIEPDMRTTGGVAFSWRGFLATRAQRSRLA